MHVAYIANGSIEKTLCLPFNLGVVCFGTGFISAAAEVTMSSPIAATNCMHGGFGMFASLYRDNKQYFSSRAYSLGCFPSCAAAFASLTLRPVSVSIMTKPPLIGLGVGSGANAICRPGSTHSSSSAS